MSVPAAARGLVATNDICERHRVLVTMLPHLSSPRNPAARRGHHSVGSSGPAAQFKLCRC